ncbi:MAG: hypothetical protein ACRDTR_14090, partial [Rubrobacter sp.]
YEDWESRYLPLDGIVGKVLNEAHYYTGKNNLPYFLRFKNQNPSKMVMLHYNGTGRRATDEATTRFYSGHFLYYEGTKLTQAISSRTQSVLHVADTSVFNLKRSMGLPDDIAITRVDANGKPRWETAEHVRLERINARDKTITVRRHLYGTRAKTFPRGSYLAAHVTTGPYRYDDAPQNNVPLWNYNFSSVCPRDAQRRNCGDALAAYLGEKLGPSGELATFDGIIFDVFSWIIRFGYPIQDIDVNTDGRADRGMIGGVNVVSKGALAFLQKLRERLPGKLLLADGHIPRESQRGFGHLNGIESEGYPDKYDFKLDHLSRGENIFDFWKENSGSPPLNYVNFKYKQRKPERYRNTFIEPNLSEDRSYRKLRLALASAHFTDTAFAYGGEEALPPEVVWREKDVRVRVFDEVWRGTDQVPHWLGQPLGPPVHLAEQATDLFNAKGENWPELFVARFEGEGVAFSRASGPIMILRSTQAGRPPEMSFVLPGIEVTGKDLFVSLRLRAEPLEGYPASVPRRVDVYAVPEGGVASPDNREFTWAGGDSFAASLYFQDVGAGTVDLKFDVEGEQQVYFERITAHSAADGRYREYEGGVVFANPSTRNFTFNAGSLFAGATLRRLQGSANQDPATNNGGLVGDKLTLPARDGLFVVKEAPGG